MVCQTGASLIPCLPRSIDQILEAGNWAPTHKLTEPWRFVVVCSLAKFELMDLTIELCRTNLPSGTAEKTVEKLQKKRDSTSDKVRQSTPQLPSVPYCLPHRAWSFPLDIPLVITSAAAHSNSSAQRGFRCSPLPRLASWSLGLCLLEGRWPGSQVAGPRE